MNTCSQCKWWKREHNQRYLPPDPFNPGYFIPDDWRGECKRHSPVRTNYISAEWPVTSEKDWCGEWEPSDQMNETERKIQQVFEQASHAAQSGFPSFNIPKP